MVLLGPILFDFEVLLMWECYSQHIIIVVIENPNFLWIQRCRNFIV
jgi:hypothetical protein